MIRWCGLKLLLLWLLVLRGPAAAAQQPEDFFESKIRPVLVDTCFRCHGDTKISGALRVDSRDSLLGGGESGPAIVPGQPEASLLIRALRRDDDVSAMPPDEERALRADQIEDFVTWVRNGAVWPEQSPRFESAGHWAFEPLREPAPPAVRDTTWVQTSVDRFIRARQELVSAAPLPPADRLTLIRRATYDLTGLPPSPDAIDAFLSDASPNAFATLVDRLLASPAYGERWGRHWLDVVRYADTAGETADYPVPEAWRYRNYVIDAFNQDKPYDQFLSEQIAGDVIAAEGPAERYAERVTATGFLAISRRFGFDSENYHHLTVQDTIDTLGQTVLGLSLGCARCHDHKFDAVTMRDYYALYGIFASSRYAFPGSEQKQRVRCLLPLVPPEQSWPAWRAHELRLAALTRDLSALKRPVPSAVLRSLDEGDGDFELQAPAAGGSNGVLVPPWLYEGAVAITNSAQSPYKNRFPAGKVGASIAAGSGPYRIRQALHRLPALADSDCVYVNLDFRVAVTGEQAGGRHRMTLGSQDAQHAVEVVIGPQTLTLRTHGGSSCTQVLRPHEWINLQLTLDFQNGSVSGLVGAPGSVDQLPALALRPDSSELIGMLTFEPADESDGALAALELDNVCVQRTPIAAVSTDLPSLPEVTDGIDPGKLQDELQRLAGMGGDFELQVAGGPPASPWHAGPNSVVKIEPRAQSPYENLYSIGQQGVHMPNRGEYDGFGITPIVQQPDASGRLCVGFDFRCAGREAGGDGTWRFYIGQGPGVSAAVELFFNAEQFFCRSADAREAVASLEPGQWYQVQLTLDTKAKTYSGRLSSPSGTHTFDGQTASGWNGAIDFLFVDSYGHLPGVRPALDLDNFVIQTEPLPELNAQATADDLAAQQARRRRAAEIREQLSVLEASAEEHAQELTRLLAEGPVPLAYAMSEGTPHDARIQHRGEPDQLGDHVPRGFLRALGGTDLPDGTAGSGRRELAEWLVSQPLTARVMANRVWQYHFGRGLVQTPNDFGVRGLPPTHPELLEHLAAQLQRSGWSIKSLHREIMLSATYQQASTRSQQPSADHPDVVDPGDLYTAFPRRRLSAEEIRDTLLLISGQLDPSPGRGHPFPSPTSWTYSQHNPFSAVYDHRQRSIYLMTQRLKRHPFLALFDGADPNTTTAVRLTTTVPTQALFFMNDPLVHTLAEAWAVQLLASPGDAPQRVELAWRSACGRVPNGAELAEALAFLAAYRGELEKVDSDQAERKSLAAYLRALMGSNEFLYVN